MFLRSFICFRCPLSVSINCDFIPKIAFNLKRFLWFYFDVLGATQHNTTDRSRKCLLKVIQNPFSRTLHNDAQRTPSGWRERQVSIFSNVRRAAPEESHSNPSNLSILLRSINYVLRKINYNFSLLHFYCTFGLPLNSIITEGEKHLRTVVFLCCKTKFIDKNSITKCPSPSRTHRFFPIKNVRRK